MTHRHMTHRDVMDRDVMDRCQLGTMISLPRT